MCVCVCVGGVMGAHECVQFVRVLSRACVRARVCVRACVRACVCVCVCVCIEEGRWWGGGAMFYNKNVYLYIVCFNVGCFFLSMKCMVHTFLGSFEKRRSKTAL